MQAGATRTARVTCTTFFRSFDTNGIYGALRNAAVEGPELTGFTLSGTAGLAINTTRHDQHVTLEGEGIDMLDLKAGLYVRVEVSETAQGPATLEVLGSKLTA